jgi:putative flippase GtrA
MTFASSRIYVTVKNKLQTTVGRRFSRFVPVAVVSLATSQLTLNVCLGLFHLTAGLSGLLGWFTGAAVSYVLSRRAWERKGRPHLLKETLPFWAVSIGTGVVLTLATHFSGTAARDMHLAGAGRLAFVSFAYLAANGVTFVTRFLIFHYFLFADRGSAAAVAVTVPSVPGDTGSAPFAVNGSAAGSSGPAWRAGVEGTERGARR